MGADTDQKTEAPSPKRRRDAVQKGDVLQSRELGAGLMLAAGAGWIWFAGSLFYNSCKKLLSAGLIIDRAELTSFDPSKEMLNLLVPILLPLFALFGLTLLAALAGPALLGSLGFRSSAFGFKASKLNPLSGLAKIFGLQGLIELAKSIAKTALLGAIGYFFLSSHIDRIVSLSSTSVTAAAAEVGAMFKLILTLLAGGMLVIAFADVPAQILQRNRRLRMTKEEVRQEHKETEGSPELKRAVRQRQHEVLSGSARKAVKEATVILTNPTHFAVALRYHPLKDAAPLVVARGRGETALAIRKLAAEAEVPMLEYPQLTRAIYYTSRAGQLVSEDLYLAVATILAFVFRLDQALAEGHSQPSVLVPEDKRFDADGKPLSS